VKRQRQAVWSLKALGSLTDPAGCCMLMGTFEYTEPLMACTSFRGAMAALGWNLEFDLPSGTQTWQWEIVYKYGSFHGEFLYNSCINGGFSIATFDYWKVMMFNGSSPKLKCSTPWQVLYHLQPPSSQLANWEMFNSIVKLLS